MATPEERVTFQLIQREIVLLIVIAAAAVPLYLFTRRMAAINRHRNAGIARDLYRRAQRQLASQDSAGAVDSLRQAVTNDRSNIQFVFALAQTLAGTHHDEEARLLLLRLRDGAPENPEINLELARLSTRQHDTQQAILYYHHALYGLWAGERIDQRRKEVRLELIHMLLERDERGRALAELLVMSAEAPQTSSAQRELGDLFTEADDLPRALRHFARAVDFDPRSFAALRGAGETAFRLGDYATAARFLTRALEQDRNAGDVSELLETATLVESRDPFRVRLTRHEQVRRLTLDLDQAERRVSDCIARAEGVGAFLPSSLEPLRAEVENMRAVVTPEAIRLDPDLLHTAFNLVFTVEETTRSTCGEPEGFDHALLLIGQRYAGSKQ